MVLVLELVHRQRFNEALLFSRIADALSTGIACLHDFRMNTGRSRHQRRPSASGGACVKRSISSRRACMEAAQALNFFVADLHENPPCA